MGNWIPILIGWPALLAAVALSGFGIFNTRPWNLYLAAVLILPISLYLAGTPRLGLWAMLPPLALAAAGFALRKNRPNVAWGLLFPVLGFYGWLLYIVQIQPG
jgi:hypothetical protein